MVEGSKLQNVCFIFIRLDDLAATYLQLYFVSSRLGKDCLDIQKQHIQATHATPALQILCHQILKLSGISALNYDLMFEIYSAI